MTDTEPEQVVENFFRHESAKLIAVLTRKFGFSLLDVVEDMVQEALCQALHTWKINGPPDNPAAWLHRVASNRILDALRRESKSQPLGEDDLPSHEQTSLTFEIDELNDSLLRMIFACCQPSLDRKSQLALTLKVLCGLGDKEIARGLLMNPSAVKKRVTRAKRFLQLNRVTMELPAPAQMSMRLDAVHEVLYLLFNEGYSTTRGDLPMRIDLCEEAARLCHLLCTSKVGQPTTFALMALMLFHAARFKSRINPSGQSILLEDQDRALWDRRMIAVADDWLTRSARGDQVSRFHLEAGIAKLHCMAPSIEKTKWQGIVDHYDFLIQNYDSPIYRLNRAIAVGQTGQLDRAIETIQAIRSDSAFNNYPLIDCALAKLQLQAGQATAAIENWERALDGEESSVNRELIQSKIELAKRSI
jgi:RNA polymerase sigma-70 factor (ECF subfamily)